MSGARIDRAARSRRAARGTQPHRDRRADGNERNDQNHATEAANHRATKRKRRCGSTQLRGEFTTVENNLPLAPNASCHLMGDTAPLSAREQSAPRKSRPDARSGRLEKLTFSLTAYFLPFAPGLPGEVPALSLPPLCVSPGVLPSTPLPTPSLAGRSTFTT